MIYFFSSTAGAQEVRRMDGGGRQGRLSGAGEARQQGAASRQAEGKCQCRKFSAVIDLFCRRFQDSHRECFQFQICGLLGCLLLFLFNGIDESCFERTLRKRVDFLSVVSA